MLKIDKELSGDTITTVNGSPYRIFSRLYNSPGNQQAAQYILEKLISYGLSPRFQANSFHNVNVIARKTGYRYPNLKIVISGHYDNTLGPGSQPSDTMYGADDNASGVVGMLEAARLLSNYNLPYTVEFVAFDEEELGYYGSIGYADSSLVSSDTILYVLNMDMIGWDSNNDGLIRIMTPSASEDLVNILINCYQKYNLALLPYKHYDAAGSDHIPFWMRGIRAISSIEPPTDFNLYYHTRGDIASRLNMDFFVKNVKANIAALMSIADDKTYFIYHNQVPSGMDTSFRIADAYIYFPVPIGLGNISPRLYYKINNGAFQSVMPIQSSNSLYSFRIPSQPTGTKISYYIAAQDSSGTYLITSPSGGSGFNPPGSTPPPTLYTYYIWTAGNYSSSNNKPINDNQFTYDTIYVSQNGIIEDIEVNLNLNHSNDGDVLLTLYKNTENSNLSQFNGEGGQNYTNTVFDDSSTVSITAGTPPFTGRFKAQSGFLNFRGKEMQGIWVLRIFDRRAGNTGNLLNWGLSFKYSTRVSVRKEEGSVPDKFYLAQNYPNPFNPVTKIKFTIPSTSLMGSFVTLKVFDLLGKEVATVLNSDLQPGSYEFTFDGSMLTTGVYFYRLTCGSFSQVKKMMIIK